MQISNQKFLRFSFLIFISSIPNVFMECCHEDKKWMREFTFGPRGDVTIKWNFTDDEITLVMIGRTQGWLAIGFALNTSLTGADIVIGWINKETKKPILQDRFGSGDNKILLDDNNDYQLINGMQNGTATIICWKRKLDTCDQQDVEIKFNTYRIFWALGQEVQSNCKFEVPDDLGSYKGVESLHLLSLVFTKPNSPDVTSIDFIANNVNISKNKDGYTYWCTHLTLPKANKKSHLIAVEPIIQKVNGDIVHHIQFLVCSPTVMKTIGWIVQEKGYDCFQIVMGGFEISCSLLLFIEAKEKKIIVLPDEIGYPLHSATEDTYFLMQTHYNVEALNSSRIDNSGIRLYYTTKLRRDDAATLIIGNAVAPFTIIPPHQTNFSNVGLCSSDCTQKTISDRNINIFGIVLHGHAAARKITMTIIRDGTEVESLTDEGFNWDYQAISFLPKNIVLKRGDEVLLHCVYDTLTRNFTTIGFFGTRDEMCLAVVFYTPPSNLTWCASYLHPKQVFDLTGINAIYPLPTTCLGADCPSVYSFMGLTNMIGKIMLPLKYNGVALDNYLHDFNWTDDKIKSLENMYFGDQTAFCKDQIYMFDSSEKNIARYPSNLDINIPKTCQNNSGIQTMESYKLLVITFLIFNLFT